MTTTTKISFIKEWTPEQFNAMDKAIRKHFWKRSLNTYHGLHYGRRWTFDELDNILGLAYTSTGIWACYGVCNTEAYYKGNKSLWYSYFTIGTDGNFYAILQDKDENETVISL